MSAIKPIYDAFASGLCQQCRHVRRACNRTHAKRGCVSTAKKSLIDPKREVVKIHVKFTLNTPDGLRRVVFDLEKDTDDKGGIDWKITFQLFERDKESDPIGDPLVDLFVEVDTKLNAKAQAMADQGMTTSQARLRSDRRPTQPKIRPSAWTRRTRRCRTR